MRVYPHHWHIRSTNNPTQGSKVPVPVSGKIKTPNGNASPTATPDDAADDAADDAGDAAADVETDAGKPSEAADSPADDTGDSGDTNLNSTFTMEDSDATSANLNSMFTKDESEPTMTLPTGGPSLAHPTAGRPKRNGVQPPSRTKRTAVSCILNV